MKASSATSGTATAQPRPTGRSSDRRPPSPTAEEFKLAGPSDSPDPTYNAYRKDLADIALAGAVIASHYAQPLQCLIGTAEALRSGPSDEAEMVGNVAPGDPFELLDNSRGWAWGYAGADRRVGYIRSSALAD